VCINEGFLLASVVVEGRYEENMKENLAALSHETHEALDGTVDMCLPK